MSNAKSIINLILIALVLILPACEKEIENPEACYILTVKSADGTIVLEAPYIVDVKQVIDFKSCGTADYYAFFSGAPGNIWSEYTNPADSTTIGADTNSNGDFTFAYPISGNYTVTVVLTNRKFKDPHNYKQVTIDFAIQVKEPEAK